VWQYFSGMDYYEPRVPCDTTQIGRFRSAIGEAGLQAILKATIDTAVASKAIKPAEFERIIVDSTVQEKAVAYPVDSRLLEIARHKIVVHAKRCGISLRQSFAKEGKVLKRKAGGYAHAKQFNRLKRTVKRQRTIVGKLIREVHKQLSAGAITSAATPSRLAALYTLLARAERIRTQQPKDKNKLYALHAPEVECISKGKARIRYEFGVKVSLAVTHKQGLMVGAQRFVGNPYDGHTLAAQISQSNELIKRTGSEVKQAFVDLGYRGVDADNGPRPPRPGVEVIRRGRIKSMSARQQRQLKRRQAIEPAIGHVKHDSPRLPRNRMIRCYLKGSIGDALHAMSCAAGYNIRWLMRAIMRLGLRGLFAFVFLVSWLIDTRRSGSAKLRTAKNTQSTPQTHLCYATI
jgi:transposase, IS5 family